MTDDQPVMIATAPGETLADGRTHARNPVQFLARLLLTSPC